MQRRDSNVQGANMKNIADYPSNLDHYFRYGSGNAAKDKNCPKLQESNIPCSQCFTSPSTIDLRTKCSSPQSLANTHKRIKLRDYLHLNDLQKRNRSQLNQQHRENHHRPLKDGDPKASYSPMQQILLKPMQSLKQIRQPDIHAHFDQQICVGIIRGEVQAKIDTQIKKLVDIKTYLSKDFTCREKRSETFLFLFTVCNQLIEIHKINEEVGNLVLDYSQKEDSSDFEDEQPMKESRQHWHSEKRLDLVSPVKIPTSPKDIAQHISHYMAIKK